MHESAMKNGKNFFEVYCKKDFSGKIVIDIGSQDVNGSLRQFCPEGAKYIGVDFVEGNGVDIVLTDPYKLPFENESVDVIVCSSVFEHSEFFWLVFLECIRILKADGLLYLNAPSNGFVHRYPIDSWRFYPDAGKALVNWSRRNSYRAILLESFISEKLGPIDGEGAWNDFVAVVLKDELCEALYPDRMINHKDGYLDGYSSGSENDNPIFAQNPDHCLIVEQQGIIASLSQSLSARDEQIAGLDHSVSERNEQILSLNQLMHERDEQIDHLGRAFSESKRQIIEIKSSTSWRVTLPLRFVGRQLKRGRFIATNLPEILRRGGGFKATLQKANAAYQRGGVDGIRRKLQTFASEKHAPAENGVPREKTHLAPHRLEGDALVSNESHAFSQLRLMNSYVADNFLNASSKVTWSSRHVPKVTDSLNSAQLSIKAIAFYLPQFHPFPENDAWWGKGFTEWTNVSKAQPQFLGHHQPHLPGELGFYDLRVPEIMRQQIELARKYGVSGFCFHYYWFAGKRLMELPINNFLADPSLNIDFCFCWANENWSRRWDGSENDILMAQNHSPEDDIAFIETMAPAFSDSRYIRVDDKPLLIVYRVSLLPDAAATAARWRKRALEMGFSGLYLVAARSFDITNPLPFGFDAAVEFPPHQVNATEITHKHQVINSDYRGKIYDYAELAARYGEQLERKFVNFKTVMPSWDNEARKPGAGHTFIGALPETYAKWLTAAAQTTLLHRPQERLLFINAWNEWAEGAHLEPDRYYGYAYLHATANVLRNISRTDGAVVMRVAEINASFIKRCDIAIIFHMHYEDLIEDIFSKYLSSLQSDVDLFVTVKKDVSIHALEEIKKWFSNVYIFVAENRGRDIRPFMLAYKEIQQKGYLYACKLHSKKSPHRNDGESWRENLMDSLVSTRGKVMNIAAQFSSNKELGLLVPQGSLMDLSISDVHMGNKKWLDLLLGRLGAIDQIGRYAFYFPAGSMYWFRVSALLPLLDEAVIASSEFDLEAGQLDGTLAHAVERVVGLLPSRLGYVVRELQ